MSDIDVIYDQDGTPISSSTSIPETIYETILKVMEDVGAVRKDGWNNNQNFNFRGVDAVINACSPAMRKRGLLAIPTVLERLDDKGTTSSGKVMLIVRLKVKYTWINRYGDTLETIVVSESNDTADKGTAKAMSVALRTAYLQTLALPTDDKDPDETVNQHGAPPRQSFDQPVALPDNWKDFVDAAEKALNVEQLAGMETDAGNTGDAAARAYIGSARLRAKMARDKQQTDSKGSK